MTLESDNSVIDLVKGFQFRKHRRHECWENRIRYGQKKMGFEHHFRNPEVMSATAISKEFVQEQLDWWK